MKKSKYKGKYVLCRWEYNKKLLDNRRCNQIVFGLDDINPYVDMIKKRSDCNYKSYITNYDKIIAGEDNCYSKYSKYQSYFEICRNNKYTKLWFDIDECMIPYDPDTIDNYIIELYDEIDKVMGIKLDREKYLVYFKNTPNLIYSFRIINYGYKIPYTHNQLLVKKIKETNIDTENPFITKLDMSVYNKDRQICLPYNAKPYNKKYEKDMYENLNPLDSPKYIFVDYNMNPKYKDDRTHRQVNPEFLYRYCISLLNETKSIKLKLTEEDNAIIEQQKHSIFNDSYFKTYGENRPKILMDNNIELLVDFILKYIDTNICEEINKKDWILLTRNLILLETPRDIIDKWLDYGVKNSDTDKYTHQSNKEHTDKEIDKLDNEVILYNKQKNKSMDLPIRHKHNKTHYFYTDYVECNINNIIAYICDKTEIDFDIVSKKFVELIDNPEAHKVKKLKITEGCIYNLKTGDLYYNDELFNYIIEKDYIPHYQNEEIGVDLEIETIHNYNIDKSVELDNKGNPVLHPELRKEIDMFKNKETKYLVIEAECGVGKSVLAKELVIHNINGGSNSIIEQKLDYGEYGDNCYTGLWDSGDLDNIQRLIMVSPNNSLNKKEYQELQAIPNNLFTNHLHIKELKDKCGGCAEWEQLVEVKIHRRHYNIVSSLESIEQIQFTDYDRETGITTLNRDCVSKLFLDEFNSIMSRFNLETKTFKVKISKAYRHFCILCALAEQIVILEADIDPQLLEHFERMIEYGKKEIETWEFIPYNPYKK